MAFLQSNLHINRPLSDMVIKFDPMSIGFARNQFFPRKPVSNLSNQIRQIDRGQLLRPYPMTAGEGGKIGRVNFATGPTLTYNATVFALEARLDNVEMANADAELQYQLNQSQAPMLALMVGLEKLAITDTLRSTANLTQNTTLASNQYWNAYTSPKSDPISDLTVACSRVASQVQKKANRLMMDHMTWSKLMQHPNVISRVLFNTRGTGAVLTPAILEEILNPWLEPGSVIIYKARYNAGAEGEAESYKSFLGPDVIVSYVDQPGPLSWGLGYEFAWNGLNGDDPFLVLQFPLNEAGALGSNVIRYVSAVNYYVTNPKAAYLIKSAVDTSLADFNSEL
jgi:hypothetical protein